jgi:hypothetical protein
MSSCFRCMPLRALALCVAFALSMPVATAALIVADFNDIASGDLNGKGGGTGFTGNWSGSAGGTVVSGNLTSSLYPLTQTTGTAQRYQSVNATGLRQNFRTVSTSPTGEVWFSLLAQVTSSTNFAGFSLNAPTASPFDNPGTVYAYLEGADLKYSFGSGTAGTITSANTLGSTALLVGRMNIVNGGPDSISLWLNPDLIANPNIFDYTPVYTNSSVDFLNSIGTLGVVAARSLNGAVSPTGSGNVDNVRFSDGNGNAAQAYFDVTAVPEPGSYVLVALGATAFFLFRRRSV